MRTSLLVFLLLSFSATTKAQPCKGPGRTAEAAEAVCGTLIFNQQFLPNCNGPNLPNPTAGCGDIVSTDNSAWYKFHCYQAGTLGFLITPGFISDDYDWELMDVTGHSASDVYTMELRISLNLSGQTGPTGCTPTGILNVHCGGGAPGSQFNQMPVLQAGHDYLLMVTNWSNSGTGYGLSFSGTAKLTDEIPPTVVSAAITNCEANKIKVTFSEPILCNTITASGSEFSVTNGTHVITGVVSGCASGSNSTTELIINLQSALGPGNYNLIINNGTDGNTFKDVCLDEMVPGVAVPFNVAIQPLMTVTGINYSGCAPKIFDVTLSKPVRCGSVTATGSEFSITPGNPAIASVQTICTGSPSYSSVIRIELQDPLPHGNYQLVVNNGTDGNTLSDTCGVALAAGYSTPLLIPQTTVAPVIQSIDYDECKPFLVTVNFDKPVRCGSLSATGSEFSVTPGALTISSVTTDCATNGGIYTRKVTLHLSGNLPAGNFNVRINNGTDGNTLSDTCFSYIPANTTRAFITTRAPAPVIDSLQYDKCTPSQIKVFYNKPMYCGSIVNSGAQWFITGPSVVNIISVSGDPATCNTAPAGKMVYSNWFILQLSAPITDFGSYVLHNRITGGFQISDTCYGLQSPVETVGFNVLGKPSAVFTGQVNFGCVMDTIVLSHPGGSGINSWEWTFSDGTTATGPSVSHTFPVSTVTATVKLIVSNGQCNDTLQRSYPLNNAFEPLFTMSPLDTICIAKQATFTNNSTGNNLQYLWQFGDNTTFAGQTPPPHSYTVSDDYTIRLIATNNYGCKDTAIKNIFATALPVISFATLNAQYCTGDVVQLAANLQGNITNYTWTNGDGKTFSNTPDVSFSYPDEKNYTVTLTANDRFCDAANYSLSTRVYAMPVVNLGEDKTFCPGLTAQIGVASRTGYTYLWNTGALTSRITTKLTSDNYVLTANNHGCEASDEIFITVMDNCLIRVAGAFTPNGDGRNDQLKAINADLATNFLLRVYNRFGQLVFTTTNPVQGWDGRQKGQGAEAGTYIWQLSYVDPISRKPVYQKGTSILLR